MKQQTSAAPGQLEFFAEGWIVKDRIRRDVELPTNHNFSTSLHIRRRYCRLWANRLEYSTKKDSPDISSFQITHDMKVVYYPDNDAHQNLQLAVGSRHRHLRLYFESFAELITWAQGFNRGIQLQRDILTQHVNSLLPCDESDELRESEQFVSDTPECSSVPPIPFHQVVRVVRAINILSRKVRERHENLPDGQEEEYQQEGHSSAAVVTNERLHELGDEPIKADDGMHERCLSPEEFERASILIQEADRAGLVTEIFDGLHVLNSGINGSFAKTEITSESDNDSVDSVDEEATVTVKDIAILVNTMVNFRGETEEVDREVPNNSWMGQVANGLVSFFGDMVGYSMDEGSAIERARAISTVTAL